MGKGDFIKNHAIRDTHINFIGIEKYESVMVRAIEKLYDKKLDNLKLIRKFSYTKYGINTHTFPQ